MYEFILAHQIAGFCSKACFHITDLDPEPQCSFMGTPMGATVYNMISDSAPYASHSHHTQICAHVVLHFILIGPIYIQ